MTPTDRVRDIEWSLMTTHRAEPALESSIPWAAGI